MNTQGFSRKLIRWFTSSQRVLPWRQTTDPYKIWISEIMLQQTTVNTVIPYYRRWIKRFPDIQSLSRSQQKTVLKLWQGLGYYNRARNLHRAAKMIVKKFNGKIPDQRSDLAGLPGFGPYTVGAVLSIAFGKREPIVDANVRRVIMRILSLKGFASPAQDKKVIKFLDIVMPTHHMSAFNQGLMELGALICRSGQVLCLQCPLRSYCKACARGIQELIPSVKRMNLKRKDVAIAVIEYRGQFFIQKRPSGGLLADLWEFPGGQREKGENFEDALAREVSEELNARVISSKLIINVKHFYTHFCANLHVFKCQVAPLPKIDRTHKWVSLKALKNYPVPSGTAKIVERLYLRK